MVPNLVEEPMQFGCCNKAAVALEGPIYRELAIKHVGCSSGGKPGRVPDHEYRVYECVLKYRLRTVRIRFVERLLC